MAVVVKPFRYARDGFTVENLMPGDDRDFGDVHDGLIAEGFIAIGATDWSDAIDVSHVAVPVDEPETEIQNDTPPETAADAHDDVAPPVTPAVVETPPVAAPVATATAKPRKRKGKQ
jgi:hypothetical protein